MIISVKVKPGSKRDEIIKDTETDWRVSLTSQPEDGKANQKLIELIAKDVGVAKGRIQITQGLKSKHKKIEILG